MTTPRVSIVVPTYNHAHFLVDAIASAHAQSVSDWEMIVVDNRSTDNTLDVIRSFADERIRISEIENEGVIARSRNRGLALARAGIVAFLDSDDRWYPRKLECCLAAIDGGADLVCHAEVWTKNGKRLRDVRYGPEAKSTHAALLYEGNCVSTSAVVARLDVVLKAGGFKEDPSLVTAEDYDLWLCLAKSGARFRFLDDLLGEYRLHDLSASSSTLRHFSAIREVAERHHRLLDVEGSASTLRMRRRRAILYYGTARGLQGRGSTSDAWPWIWRAIATYPLLPRAYAAAVVGLFPQLNRS